MFLPFVLFTRLSLLILVSASPNSAKDSAFSIVVLPVPFLDPASSPPRSMFCPNTNVSSCPSKLRACVTLPTLIKFFTVSVFSFIINFCISQVTNDCRSAQNQLLVFGYAQFHRWIQMLVASQLNHTVSCLAVV